MSVAPTSVNSSITLAIRSFSTIELTATHAGSSSAVMVGARLPGVIFVAASRIERSMLYWQRTYLCAAARITLEEFMGGLEGDGGRESTYDAFDPCRDDIDEFWI